MAQLKYATKQQLGQRLREAYANAQGEEVYRIAAKIQSALDAGDFTDADMKGYFGATVWAQAKGHISANANQHAQIKNAKGE